MGILEGIAEALLFQYQYRYRSHQGVMGLRSHIIPNHSHITHNQDRRQILLCIHNHVEVLYPTGQEVMEEAMVLVEGSNQTEQEVMEEVVVLVQVEVNIQVVAFNKTGLAVAKITQSRISRQTRKVLG